MKHKEMELKVIQKKKEKKNKNRQIIINPDQYLYKISQPVIDISEI